MQKLGASYFRIAQMDGKEVDRFSVVFNFEGPL